MISAQELRIGNWLHLKYNIESKWGRLHEDAFEQVKSLGFDHLLEDQLPDSYLINHNNRSWYEPIPLTESILLKAGFEFEDMADLGVYINLKISNEDATIRISFYQDSSTLWVEGYNTKHKYLHQLQNLFYFLVGEELKIEL